MVKKTNKKRYLTIASVLLAAVLIIALVVGLSSAKYKTEKRLTGDVKFTVKLADKILIQEHEAVRQDDGSYVLDMEKVVEEQPYDLMPGVDVPKDPYITVEGKTPIPAYLYVEIVEGSNFPVVVDENGEITPLIKYNVTGDWKPLVDNGIPVTGLNGGKVYVYNDILTDKNTKTDDEKLVEFQILDYVNGSTTDTLEVSDALPRSTKDVTLSFYAYICQKYTDDKVANFSIRDTAELTTAESAAPSNPSDGSSAGGN